VSTATLRRAATDRLNPILVKEVRQALRGRYFKILFWLTLAAATFLGLIVVGSAAERIDERFAGQSFFMVIFGCLSAAVHGFTPFSAYLSTSAEWDENTHDLLVLSDLRPRQIVLGKLLSALVQALLYYSTFGPFLVFAFLLNGIDLLSIGVVLVCSTAACTGLSSIGIALATMAKSKAMRGLLMAVFGAALAGSWGLTMAAAAEIVQSPQDLRSSEGQMATLLFLTVATALGMLFSAVAALRFAHEEENRSTGLRLASLGIVLLAGAWGAGLHRTLGEHEAVFGVQLAAALVLYLLWLFFLTERDGLSRRVAQRVPSQRGLALLAAPFLPGGGNAVWLVLVHGGCALLATWLGLGLSATTELQDRQALTIVGMVYGYPLLFLGIPAAFTGFVRTPGGRTRLRLACFFSLPLAVLAPGLLGLLSGNHRWMELEHPLNPAWVLSRFGTAGSPRDGAWLGLTLLLLGVLVALVLNVPRMVAGLEGVLAASRARRRRARVS